MSKQPQMAILDGDGSFQIEVVGESRYHANLKSIAGDHGDASVDLTRTAYMVPEPHNLNDPNAVRVDIEEKCVGYLPRQLAANVSPAVRRVNLVAIQAQAHITAGFDGGHYSVWLDGDLPGLLIELATMKPLPVAGRRRFPWW